MYPSVHKNVFGLMFISDIARDIIVEIRSEFDIKSRTVERIVWFKTPTKEMYQNAFYAMVHSKAEVKMAWFCKKPDFISE